MNKSLIVRIFFIAGLVGIAAIGTGVIAQRGPWGGQRGGPMRGGMPLPMRPVVMKAVSSGLFVLAGNTLTKYDASTLKKVGSITLVEKKADQGRGQEVGRRPMMRPIAAEMILGPATKASQSVLVVIGDTFLNIDTAKFTVKAKGSLPEWKRPEPPADGSDGIGLPGGEGDNAEKMGPPPMPDVANSGEMAVSPRNDGPVCPPQGPGMPGPAWRGGQFGPGMPQMMGMPPMGGPLHPSLELHGNTLYVLRGNEIAAVNITDGKVMAKASFPRPQRPGQ